MISTRLYRGFWQASSVLTQCVAFLCLGLRACILEPSNTDRNLGDSMRSGKKNSGSSDHMILLMGEIIPIQLQYIIPKTIIM